MTITTIDDAVGLVRMHSMLYLGGEPTPALTLSQIVKEAMLLTPGPVTCARVGEWWLIHSELDWFGTYATDVQRLFTNIIPYPEAGPNSALREVVLTAFSAKVLTVSPHGTTWIKGSTEGPLPFDELVQARSRSGRLVAFTWQED